MKSVAQKNSLFMAYRLVDMQRICVSNVSLLKDRNIYISLYLQALGRMAIFNFTGFPNAQLHEPIGSMKLKTSSDWFGGIRATKSSHRMVNSPSLSYLNPASEILVGNFIWWNLQRAGESQVDLWSQGRLCGLNVVSSQLKPGSSEAWTDDFSIWGYLGGLYVSWKAHEP